MRKLLFALLSLAPFAFGAAITTIRAGNWSDTNALTSPWPSGVVPTASDTVTIDHAVTLDGNHAVGNCQVVGSTPDAIKINAGGRLIWATNAALTARGNISATNTSTTVMALTGAPGAQLIFDPSCAGPGGGSTHQYKLTFAGNPSGGNFVGDPSNRAVIKTLRTNGDEFRAYQDYTGAGTQGWRTLQYVDFTDFGDATHNAVELYIANPGDITYSNNTFTSCGRVVFMSTGASGNWRFNNNKFATPLNAASLTITPTTAFNGTDAREVIGNEFGGDLETSGGSAGLDIHHNVFRRQIIMYAFGTTTVKSFHHNLFAPPSSAPFTTGPIGTLYGIPDFNNNYMAVQAVGGRVFSIPDGTNSNALSQKLNDNIAEFINPVTAAGTGNMFISGPVASSATYEFRRNLLLHASGTSLSMTFINNPPRFSTIEHNTIAAGTTTFSAILVANSYTWPASGDVSYIRSNIFWQPSGSGTHYKVIDYSHQTTGGPSNIVSPSNVGFNASFHMKLTSAGGYANSGNGYQMNLSAAIGTGALGQQSDLDNVDPQFVEPTRGIGTYWTAGLGNGTAGSYLLNAKAAIDYIAANPLSRIEPMMTWVRDGYKIQNAALHGTAHDTGDVGAFAFAAPATNPAVFGRTLVADSQIQHPGLDAGVN